MHACMRLFDFETVSRFDADLRASKYSAIFSVFFSRFARFSVVRIVRPGCRCVILILLNHSTCRLQTLFAISPLLSYSFFLMLYLLSVTVNV